MTPEQVPFTVVTFPTICVDDCIEYPNGHKFDRLTLTLSKKGWTSSVQWKGTLGARGTGKTAESAIEDSLAFARKTWKASVFLTI
jgi:hypothetical protein